MGKNLDAELAEAAGIGDETSPMSVPQTSPARDPGGPPPPRRGNVGLLAALLIMVGAVVVLFLFGLKEAPIYAMSLEDFMAQGDDRAGRRVRIDGELVPGSLAKRDKPCEFRFMLRDAAKKEVPNLEIRFPQCIVPDTFRDVPEGGVFVTAEGTMKDGHFEANEIMAKCSSKYNPDTHQLDGAPKKKSSDGDLMGAEL
jgi:cytochrome c-type biogenesis protein CcmE